MITGDERKSTVNRGLPSRPLRYILYASIDETVSFTKSHEIGRRMRRTYVTRNQSLLRAPSSLEEEGETNTMARTIFTVQIAPKEEE